MRTSVRGYWFLSWAGLFANVIALPVIAFVVSSKGSWQVANISVAVSLAWPAAIVGIVASAGLLAERQWGILLAIIALSMALSGTFPYAITRLVMERQFFGISGVSLLVAVLNLLGLVYWCLPGHRRIRL